MAKKKLTPKGIERLSVTTRTEISDADCPGLVLRATPTGRKSFFSIIRTPDGLRRISIGSWPAVSLVEARAEVRRLREVGVPTQELTFNDVMERFVEFQRERGKRTWKQQQRQLQIHVAPELGMKRPHQVRTQELFALMKTLDKKGETIGENVFSLLRTLFTWAERRGWVQSNPASVVWADVKRSKPRDRVLSDSELSDIWHACTTVHPAARDLTRMLILLGQRRTETSLMRRENIKDGVWAIPPNITKNGREHRVPLSKPALAIIDASASSPLVFSSTGGDKSVSGYSYVKKKLAKEVGFEDWTYHDLRRTMTTRMAEIGIPDHVVDRILNHSVTRSTRAKHYDRYTYMKEKAEALEVWGVEVLRIVGESECASRD